MTLTETPPERSDVIDLRGLFRAIGYAGSDLMADGWLKLTQAVGGTCFVVDPHNGQATSTELVVQNVAPGALHQGTDFLTVSAQA